MIMMMMMMSRPVCHNGWDYADANVVCRSLGYIGALDFTLRCSVVMIKLSDNHVHHHLFQEPLWFSLHLA